MVEEHADPILSAYPDGKAVATLLSLLTISTFLTMIVYKRKAVPVKSVVLRRHMRYTVHKKVIEAINGHISA